MLLVHRVTFLLGFLLIFSNATFAQDLICSTELAAGISYDRSNGRWVSNTFASDAKYVLSNTSRSVFKMEVRQLGTNTPVALCNEDFSKDGTIQCGGLGITFFFNRKTMRFLSIYSTGYWNENTLLEIIPERKEGDDTPAITGGVCANI